MLAGGGAADEAELCAPVERGVYVTRLWYANVVRPKETLITAVTRDGTFLIEDGRVTRPLRDLRLTDSVLGILSRTQALGRDQKLTSDGEFYGRRFAYGVVCPAASGRGAVHGRRRVLAFSAVEADARDRQIFRTTRSAKRRAKKILQSIVIVLQASRRRQGPAPARSEKAPEPASFGGGCSRIEHDHDTARTIFFAELFAVNVIVHR